MSSKVLDLISYLTSQNITETEAWWLLEKLTGKTQIKLLTEEVSLTHAQEQMLSGWVKDHVINHKPILYILGEVTFCSVKILLQSPVLIPRPETEEWTLWLIKQLEQQKSKDLTILDLCCGTGCISLALANTIPKAKIFGIDISPQAIVLSGKNSLYNNINNVQWVLSDLYNNLPEDFKCDLIVSNPPYVLQEEFATLSPQVRLWEDKNALVPAPGWHEFYGRILSGAKQFLRPSDNLNFIEQKRIPKIVLEIGPAQNGIRSFINNYNFSYCEVFKDICGKLRWVAIYV